MLSAEQKLRNVRFQLKWNHQFQFAGYYMAKKMGYYREAGLEVQILEGGVGISPVRGVVEGGADFGIDASEILLYRKKGMPVVALGAILQHSPLVILSAGKGGAKKPQDLSGKKVFMGEGYGDVEVIAMLDSAGVKLESITRLGYTLNPADLLHEDVAGAAAYLTNFPYLLQVEGVDYHVINPSDYGIDFYSDILFTNRNLANQYPEVVEGFLQASLKGWQYAFDNPEEAAYEAIELGSNRTVEHLLYEAAKMKELAIPDIVELGHMSKPRWRSISETFYSIGLSSSAGVPDDFLFDPIKAMERKRSTLKNFLGVLFVGIALAGIAVLVLWVYSLNLRKTVERSTAELKRANDGLKQQILKRLESQTHMQAQRDLAVGVMSSESLIEAGRMAILSMIRGTKMDFGGVYFFEEHPKCFRLAVWQDLPNSFVEEAGMIEEAHPLYGKIMKGRALYTPDLIEVMDEIKKISGTKVKSIAVCPMASQGNVFGFVFVVGVKEAHLESAQKRLLETLTAELTNAISRKRAEEARVASERLYRGLYESLIDGIVGLNRERKIVECNKAFYEMLGYEKNEILGKSLREITPEDFDSGDTKAERELERRGFCEEYEKEFYHGGGGRVPVSIKAWKIDAGDTTTWVMVRNIMEKRRAEHALRENEHFLNNILSVVRAGIMIIDAQTRTIVEANPAIFEMSGKSREDVIGKHCGHLFCMQESGQCPLEQRAEATGKERENSVIKDQQGRSYIRTVSEFQVNDRVYLVESYSEISDLVKLEEKLRLMATHDELTGLFNRRALMETLQQRVEFARRYKSRLTLCVCDLDHFKQVNDTYGHQLGDEVLQRFASIISKNIRDTDTAGRFGGDEFFIIFPSTSTEQAVTCVERIRKDLSKEVFKYEEGGFQLTGSFGLASLTETMTELEQLVQQADAALYSAKRKNRNQSVTYRQDEPS